MRSHTDLAIKLMIRKYGTTMEHRRKLKTDLGDGDYEESWEVKEPKRGQFIQITASDTVFYMWGQKIDADAIATFLPGTDILEKDQFKFNDIWYEVDTKFSRETGGVEDYIEVLLRRSS